MRILQISASYKPAYVYGGPTMSVSKLSEQLVLAGCTVEVYTTTANGAQELDVVPGEKVSVDNVPVTYFKRITGDHSHLSPQLISRLRKTVRQFDVVHIHAWWNLVSVLSALIAAQNKIPLIISPRGTLSNYSFNNKNISAKKLLHNLLGKRLLNAAWLHTTSVAEQRAMKQLLQPKMISVIPNFVKLPAERPAKKTAAGSVFKLIYFSRIEEKKGLDILLKSLPVVKVPYHLTIAGDGDETYISHLKHITADNGSAEHVSWIGFLDSEKFDVLSAHDLLVLPSHDENFGNVVIESLSTGTAVLISKGVGLADYIRQNELGWLCDINPASVSDAINNIAQNEPETLSRIARQAPAIINRDFDDGNLAEKYISMYKQIIKNERV